MKTVIVTGAAGLIGSKSVKSFAREVYNIGGSRHSNCSMLEAIDECERISEKKLKWTYVEDNLIGDHIWRVSDVREFQAHYPGWKFRYGLKEILTEIHAACIA